MKVFAIIPAYNEAETIESVLTAVRPLVDGVVVVNDGSGDQTEALARGQGAIVLNHFINRGQGAALQTGIIFALKAGADAVVTYDADGQFLAEEIETLLAPIRSGQADVVLGSRFLSQGAKHKAIPVNRRLVLGAATWLTKLYTGMPITDTHNGFRVLNRKAASLISIKHDGMAHASEIIEQIKKHNLRFVEAPVTVRYTDYSLKKGQKLTHSFKIFWDLFFSRLHK